MSKKTYYFKGKLYNDDYWKDDSGKYAGSLGDLLDKLADDGKSGLTTATVTIYYLGGDYVCTDDDIDTEELLENMIYGGYLEDYDIKEVKED